MRMSRKRFVMTAAGLAAVIGTALTGRITASAATPPGWGNPAPAGVFGNGFETDVRLDYTGTNQIAYEAAPQTLSSSISTVQRSLDAGLTWKLIPGQASGDLGGKNFTCPAGGGDVELD